MNTSDGESNRRHFLQPTRSGAEEMKAEREEAEARRAENPPEEPFVDNTPMGPLRTFFANMKAYSNARLTAEDNGTWGDGVKAVGIGGLVLLTSLFAPASKASAEVPDLALNQAFAVCMSSQGFEDARLTDVTPTMIQFATAEEGPLSIDLAANRVTGRVMITYENGIKGPADYTADHRWDEIPRDCALARGFICIKQALATLDNK